jgi:hypothetical protein
LKVEIDDVLFWMDAIRNSEDRYRTLESFWKGQVRSKVWLVENLEEMTKTYYSPVTIAIHGGWNGVLASLLFNSQIPIKHITSIDIDPSCEEIATTVNKRQEMEGRFSAVTADMTTHKSDADIIINTSCEHITQEQYNAWLELQPSDALFVVQGNNYYELDEHIRCSQEGNEFLEQSNLTPHWRGAMETPKYTRFMIIGKKNV